MGVKNGGMKKKTNSSTRGNEPLSDAPFSRGNRRHHRRGLAGCTGKFAINGSVGGSKTGEKGVRKVDQPVRGLLVFCRSLERYGNL